MRAASAVTTSAVLAAAVAAANRRSIAGAIVVLVFLALAPGVVVTKLLRIAERGAARLAIVIATSFAFDAIVTEAMVYLRVWTAPRGVVVLCALTIVLAALERAVARTNTEAHRT